MLKSGAFAELIGVSKQQVNNYRLEGMPSIKKGNYYYYTFEAIEWLYITERRELKSPTSTDIKKMSLPERKMLIDIKLKELDYEKKTSKVIPLEVAKQNGARAGLFIRDILSSLPDRFIPKLKFNEEEKHYLKEELKKEIYETLVNISNFAKHS